MCRALSTGNMCDDHQKDKCGCCPDWGWEDDRRSCEPGDSTDDSEEEDCEEWFAKSRPTDPPRRRRLQGTGAWNGQCKDPEKDECGCCPGWGWDDDWGCARWETTDWEDAWECKALKNRTCNEEDKDECGCCPGWGWDDDDGCEPGETTDWEDRRECRKWLSGGIGRRLAEADRLKEMEAAFSDK